MHHFESTTLGEALGANPIDENAITELSEEYLAMVHGGASGIVSFIVKEVITYLAVEWAKGSHSGPTQSGDPSNGTRGAGGSGGSGGNDGGSGGASGS